MEVKKEDARPAKAQPIFSLSSMCAAQLLLDFASDSHPRLLRCWVAHAVDLDKLAASALAATSKLLGSILAIALAKPDLGVQLAMSFFAACAVSCCN